MPAEKKKGRGLYVIPVIFQGLLSAQILAFFQIYVSNSELYRTLELIQIYGYLTVPNRTVMEGLRYLGPAFYGGVFFTLSIGAGLSSFTFVALWSWDRLFRRSRLFIGMLVFIWAGCILGMNRQGIMPFVTLYFLVVPAVVAAATLKLMPVQDISKGPLNKRVHVISFAVIALLCASQIDRDIFVDFRDNFFLSNSIGSEFNDFYYKYTLYPAEVIKPLDQKMLKTVVFEKVRDESIAEKLKSELIKYNYLYVDDYPMADLAVADDGDMLTLKNRERVILQTKAEDFLSAPGAVLKEFSSKSDRLALFRELTFIFIVTGLPLTVYLVLFSVFRIAASFFINSTGSLIVASFLCIVTGIVLVATLEINNESIAGTDEIAGSLQSSRWQTRMAALRVIEKNGIEVSGFASYRQMLKSPYPAERYWLARALGVSRRSETLNDLRAFLDDPHPNVVSMALLALGRRGDTAMIGDIIRRINESDHWYEQMYAYNTLMELGWRQKLSD